jgi:hypothetical protein
MADKNDVVIFAHVNFGRLNVIQANAGKPDEPKNANATQSLIDS